MVSVFKDLIISLKRWNKMCGVAQVSISQHGSNAIISNLSLFLLRVLEIGQSSCDWSLATKIAWQMQKKFRHFLKRDHTSSCIIRPTSGLFGTKNQWSEVFINHKDGTEIVIFYIRAVLLVHDPWAFLIYLAIKISATNESAFCDWFLN